MNGSHDPRISYPQPAQPPDPAQYDPGLGAVPPTWRKNIYGYGEDPRRKSPALAGILSLMPGLGQVYVGYYTHGFINVIVCGGTIFLLSISNGEHPTIRALDPFLGFFLGFYWLYNIVDAFRRAAFYNHALAGLGPVPFPDEMKLPKAHASMAGGIALIAVGLLLVANTAFDVSLDWLEHWWPMGLVLLGGWLVYRNITEKRAAPAPPAHAPRSEQP